jgi:broad specificity phosphatase PhoE
MDLIYLRHAEALKNKSGIHGGSGTELSETGVSQAIATGQRLKSNTPNTKYMIVGGTSNHVIRTAQCIQQSLNCTMQFFTELDGIDLGVLHGMSEAEAQASHPAAYDMLVSWSTGKLGINDLKIEGMEDPINFKGRIFKKLTEIEAEFEHKVVLVGTRSNLILIENAVCMYPTFNWSKYRVFGFEYCTEKYSQIRWIECK